MKVHDFVFSGKRRHRIIRHVAFWSIWCLAYLLFVHYPVHSFKGWAFNPAANQGSFGNIERIGLPLFLLKTLLINALMAIVLPQVLFVYVFLYWFLPNFIYRKRDGLLTIGVLAGVLAVYYLAAVCFKLLIPLGNFFFGLSGKLVFDYPLSNCVYGATRDLITSLPIVAGFALLIKQVKQWWLKQQQTAQLTHEKTSAELQLLKAQVHPHFLFNTLNNIYFFALNASPKAPEMIQKLSALLHYILYDCNQPLVLLQKEIQMLKDYLALEKVRYGEGMKMTVSIEGDFAGELIAPLLLIPFVENSFKHGASKMITHPWVSLHIMVNGGMLHFTISNSLPSEAESSLHKGNIGLKNVQKRLQLLYPAAHDLSIVAGQESFTVDLKLQLKRVVMPDTVQEEPSILPYAMA